MIVLEWELGALLRLQVVGERGRALGAGAVGHRRVEPRVLPVARVR